jgi:hypothetical protein
MAGDTWMRAEQTVSIKSYLLTLVWVLVIACLWGVIVC